MGKIIQFKNKPLPLSYGQYYYDNEDDIVQPIEESDGVIQPFDKFSTQTLQTTVVSDNERDFIIDNKLRFIGISNIQINDLTINNAGVNHKVKNTLFRGFIFDKNTFDCFLSNGNLKSYDEINNALYANTNNQTEEINLFGNIIQRPVVNNTRLFEHALFFNWDAPRYGKKKGPGKLDFLTDQIILENINSNANANLTMEVPEYLHPGNLQNGISNFSTGSWDMQASSTIRTQPFNPNDGKVNEGERITSIFSEDGQNNYLQFVIWTKGDARRTVGTKRRRKRLYVFKVNINELFDIDSNGTFSGTEKKISFSDFKSVSGGGGTTPAWVVSNFSITINTFPGVSINNFVPNIILPNDTDSLNILESIVPPSPIRVDSFNEDFINLGIFTEPKAYSTSFISKYGNDFTPTAFVTIKDTLDKNLQGYQTNETDRQICSAPSTIELRLNISEKNQNEEVILQRAFPHSQNIPPFYKFCVVDWDDKDNKIKTVKDALNLKPLNFNEILQKKENNTFIFEDIDNTLLNSYSTPGIKQIKVLMFSFIEAGVTTPSDTNINNYSYLPSDEIYFKQIEPLRYKLMTVRIFLDIPVNQFPDFGEVGGSDYKTIPWPFVTPIINGISNESKYYKSIDNVLGGGKIGDVDVIDETFLKQAKENDMLGKTIEQFDLEQCRYFDKPYDIYNLLNIDFVIGGESVNESVEYLSTLPFPQYIEEFNIADDGVINPTDATQWITLSIGGRNDIGNLLGRLLGGNPIPTQFQYPDYVYQWTSIADIPFGNGLQQPIENFINPSQNIPGMNVFYNDFNYYDGETNKFPEESSVGQIFISDNQDIDLKQSCKLELNTGKLVGKSIYDSSGNSNKGLLIGDYRIKKFRKGEPMRRDSFIKVPKKTIKNDGAL